MNVQDFEDFEEVLRFSKSEEYRRLRENNYLSEYEKAVEEGRKEGLKIAAKNAIKAGFPVKQIASFTGLSVEEINKLK